MKFDSILELDGYLELEKAERNGIIKDLKVQQWVELRVGKYFKRKIRADYTFIRVKDKKFCCVDAKGKRMTDWQIKWELALELFPEWVFATLKRGSRKELLCIIWNQNGTRTTSRTIAKPVTELYR